MSDPYANPHRSESDKARYKAARAKLVRNLLREGGGCVKYVVVGIVVLIVLGGLVRCLGGGGSSGDTSNGSSVDSDVAPYLARSACKDQVKSQLQAPGDAKFDYEQDNLNGSDANSWSVSSSGTVTSSGVGYDYVCAVSVMKDGSSTSTTVVSFTPR